MMWITSLYFVPKKGVLTEYSWSNIYQLDHDPEAHVEQ